MNWKNILMIELMQESNRTRIPKQAFLLTRSGGRDFGHPRKRCEAKIGIENVPMPLNEV
jgi:hypothetical protein